MANINIYGDLDSGSIFFINSTVDPKALGTIVASVIDHNGQDRIKVERSDRFQSDGVSFRVLFEKLNPTRVMNRDGEELISQLGYTVQQVVDYINAQSQLTGANGGDGNGTDVTDVAIDFKLDATSTSIMLDNGFAYGVNTIKAIADTDGLITIVSELGDLTYFTKLAHTSVSVDGSAVSGGLNDVVNVLNELFTVGPFESVVISDPYSTMIADVAGVDAGYTLEGADAVDPIGDDIFTYDGSGYANYAGLKSTATIDQAGEYYTFDIRGEGTIGFGLVHTQASFDDGKYDGNVNYANPANFAAVNSAHYGYQFSHWFHGTPNGSWTNYGALTTYSMQAGWSNWDQKQDWLDGNPVKIRCGIDTNGYISIESLQDDGSWVVHSRSGYPVQDGSSFHLGIKSQSTSARVYSAPKVHLLEPEAPTMYFRYIESPDGVFHYPLFTTAEEANYYDEITNGLTAGTGSSHTHTYADDPTGTTWYMPEASHDASTYTHTSAPSATTFNGNPVTYTEVTSVTDADLTPSAFSGSNYTYEEGTVVNLQLQPQDVSYTTSVDISPAGSGLVFSSGFLLQGTLNDVSTNTVYTVTVTRANSYGSSIGSFTITSTDVPVQPSNTTPWTKALDFSGSNEHAKQVSSSHYVNALKLGGYGVAVANNTDSNKTVDNGFSFPWATAIVFRSDRNNSNQHIWNSGEGAGSSDDNIYLRTDSVGILYFGWGRGSDNNECTLGNVTSTGWNGVYIAFKGGRFNSSNATAANLSDAFSIKRMGSEWNVPFGTVGAELSTTGNWVSTGNRTDRSFSGDFTIAGRGSNRSFHGKVASMVITTLKRNDTIPTDAEIELMITDPIEWVAQHKVGKTYRYPNTTSNYTNFQVGDTQPAQATQVWLMGDGASDSYANGMRNYIQPSDQNWSKLQLNSMVSNDIQTVNINGLT